MQKFDFLKSIISSQKIVEPGCGEQDIVVTIFVIYVHAGMHVYVYLFIHQNLSGL